MTMLVDACVGNSTGVGAASGIGLIISQALCDWACQHIPAYALQVGKGMPLCSCRNLCRSQLIIWHCTVGHTGGLWMGPGFVLVPFRCALWSPNACLVLASLSWVHDTVVLLTLACPIVCATWTADVVYHRQQMLSIPAKPACNCISYTQSHSDAQPCCCSIPLKFGIYTPRHFATVYLQRCATMLAGDQLAISSHGSVLQIASGFQRRIQEGSTAGFQLQQMLGLQEMLPLRCMGYLSETKLIGAGFDGEVCVPRDECVHQVELGGMQSPCHDVPGRIL